ncbi:DoxX family protein [Variovorax sp. EBFNA2]|uniref:DoxX family protein n=1 Tax=Variovorax sp. EBFNA2 TaxID=3342097 RepID=UPI0029BFF9CA|nr:DoxX family protein [Variovorax boronicumulans]WPG41160.1 DoxX family protein [Variovorax boronicumulans]
MPLIFPRLRGLYDRLEPLSYLLLRIAFGLMLMTHGVPKLLGRSHGSMADPMAGSVNLIANVLHLPAAPLIGWFIALLEGVGGLMLAAGLFTRLVAPMVAVQMLVICYLLAPTFPWIDRGFEYPLMLAFVALCITTRGSGRGSVDAWLGREL